MLLASLLLVLASIAGPRVNAEPLGSGRTDSEWKRVEPDIELAFPADHGAHSGYKIEWWYITGQLVARDGRRFGFQFTVFRSGTGAGPVESPESPLRAHQVLAGHLALTDVAAGRTRFAERLRRSGSALTRMSVDDLDVGLEDWSLRRGAGDVLALAAGDAASGFGLELELVPSKPLVLHGENGYSSKGVDAGNASAYVSWTRLATKGRIEVDGEPLEVQGEAWFDHEFGTSVLEAGVAGWDWFGLQLEDGRELMVFLLRRADGTLAPASSGTLVDDRGIARKVAVDAFQVESDASWSSPHTGAKYPARWTISVPSASLALEVVPLVADCELVTRSTGVAYWEGPVEVRGAVKGRGYAELTGYAGSLQGRL